MDTKQWIPALAVLFLAISCALPTAASGPDRSVAAADVELPAVGQDLSYVACYFGSPSSSTWRWALAPGNSWFTMDGTWAQTKYTGLEKFFADSVSITDLRDACTRAQSYYGESGELFAMFAATHNVGGNYPIILSGDSELYPQY